MQEAERLVILHLQDVRMSGNEELRRVREKCGADAEVVIARIAANMFDEHVYIFTLEPVQFTIHQPQVPTIAVATDGTQRPEGCQFLCHLDAADVTGMPYLVAGFKVVQVLRIPVAVCVADNTDSVSFSQIRQ